ncbi:MAG: cyclase family protein [Gammaproteobacteria bacterium]
MFKATPVPAIALSVYLFAPNAAAFDPASHHLIDLTHSYNNKTLYWPTSTTKFEKQSLYYGITPGGYFYSANAFCTPEHGGTHIDAPIHFAADRFTTDEMPLQQLIAPGVMIDVSDKAASNRDYRLTANDILAFERTHGQIQPGTIVLLKTGWDRYWPNAKAYLGDDTPGDASKLSFPSYGEDAARLLAEKRRVAIIGVDTASIDYGRSKDFIVHRITAAHNIGGLENLTLPDQLPPTGFTIIALPMKIADGSGGPVRVVAAVPASR